MVGMLYVDVLYWVLGVGRRWMLPWCNELFWSKMTRICIRVGVYVAQHGADFAAIRRVQQFLQTTTKDAASIQEKSSRVESLSFLSPSSRSHRSVNHHHMIPTEVMSSEYRAYIYRIYCDGHGSRVVQIGWLSGGGTSHSHKTKATVMVIEVNPKQHDNTIKK